MEGINEKKVHSKRPINETFGTTLRQFVRLFQEDLLSATASFTKMASSELQIAISFSRVIKVFDKFPLLLTS